MATITSRRGRRGTRYERDVLPTKPEATAANYRRHLRWWRRRLGKKTLSELTRDDLITHRTRLARQRSAATANRYMASLSHAMNLACSEWDWVKQSPLYGIKRLREPRGRVRYLEDAERERLLAACEASDCRELYLLVLLALSTGGRKGELLRLAWPDVDFRHNQITFVETKNGERRSVPLAGKARELLAERSRVRRIDTKLVFPRDGGRGPVDVRYAWQRAACEAGLYDFRFHDLRHTFASYLAMNGATLRCARSRTCSGTRRSTW